MRENLKCFGANLQLLTIRQTHSIDVKIAKWLPIDSNYGKLIVLDLGYNQLCLKSLRYLMHPKAVYANTLKKLLVERNQI